MNAAEDRRAHVHAALEEASGGGISVEDPTADELIAAAEMLAAPYARLLGYIYDLPKPEGFSAADFARWHRARTEEATHVIR